MRSDVTQNITAVTLIVKNKDCINSTSYDKKTMWPSVDEKRVYDANNARTQCVIHFVLYRKEIKHTYQLSCQNMVIKECN